MTELDEHAKAFLNALDFYGEDTAKEIRAALTEYLTAMGLSSLAVRFRHAHLEHQTAPFENVVRMRNPLPLLCLQPGYLKEGKSPVGLVAALKEAYFEKGNVPEEMRWPDTIHY
ncbi:MAG: hypothetical protein Q7S65_06600 [Nanoarchaeota archaeon]|nr:hypothetical protein [Nanoarchaeota archaeon]